MKNATRFNSRAHQVRVRESIRAGLSQTYRRRQLRQGGFTLVWALIAAFGVLLTGLALASRTFFGTFASVNQQDTRRAREAAEIGIARVVRELNRERNRKMLAIRPTNDQFWSQAEIDSNSEAINRCAATTAAGTPARLQIGSGGAGSTGSERPVVYLANNGGAVASNSATPANTSPNGESYGYRLLSITPAPSGNLLNAFWPATSKAEAGLLELKVQGFSYNNGRLSGSVVVEQQVEVVPKCCSQSLGGNNNPVFGNDTGPCVRQLEGKSFGLVFGTALDDDGDITLTGGGGTITSPDGTPLNPITCVGRADPPSNCPSDVRVGGTDPDVIQINEALPPVPSFPFNPPPPVGGIGGATFDAKNLNLAALPANCRSNQIPVDGQNVDVIHCRINQISSDTNVITSDTRWVRFYMDTNSNPINLSSPNKNFTHCRNSTCTAATNPLLRLQLYGSNTLEQTINFRGNATSAADTFFAYFPTALWKYAGSGKSSPDMVAMLWVNELQGKGNTQMVVPGSGIGDVLTFLPGGGTNNGQGGNPSNNKGKVIINDYVARAVRQFRLLPGQ